MLEIAIPGAETLRLDHLVADFNGTLAVDGELLPGAGEALRRLAESLALHVVTADTFGKDRDALAGIPCELAILTEGAQDSAKLSYIEALGAHRCVCLGNGRNDRMMLAAAGLGIAVMQGKERRWKPCWRRKWPCPTSTRPWGCCFIRGGWWPRCGPDS